MQKKKNVKIWIIMLVLPFALLFVVTVGQIIVNFALTNATNSASPDNCSDGIQSNLTIDGSCREEEAGSPKTIVRVINGFSILTGTLSVIGILAYPIWIALLVVAIQHNKKIDEALKLQNTPQNQPPQPPVI